MLFRLTDHYNAEIKEEEVNDCFICYENEMTPIKLNSNKYYLKECKCEGYVHIKCLTIWYEKNKKCPICRISMIEKPNIAIYMSYKTRFVVLFLLTLKKNTRILMRIFSALFLLFLMCEYYTSISNKVYHNYRYGYDYEYPYLDSNNDFLNKSYYLK